MPKAGAAGSRGCRREWATLTLAAVLFLAVRLPFLPPTLDDIDGLNFDLGTHDYNPVAHRPHPPGFPVFILLAKAAHPLFSSHAGALAFLSAIFSSLSVFPVYFLARALASRRVAVLAAVLTLFSPLVWFNSVRPMSDLTGFFMVLTSQSLLVAGAIGLAGNVPPARRLWHAGVLLAGLAAGVRLQALVLVGPVLLFGWIRFRSIRLGTMAGFAGSAAAWVVPLLILSGGPAAYFESLSRLVRDALPVEPLVSSMTIRRAIVALWDVLGAPWGSIWLAVPMLMAAAVGVVAAAVSNRRMLGWVLLLALPYATYHYLLQMTATTRYAVPLVPFVSLLAAAALVGWRPVRRPIVGLIAAVFVMVSAASTLPALAAYHATPSPAARALAYIQNARANGSFVVTGHFVFARYLSSLSTDFEVLSSPPGRIWEVLTAYWKAGGRKPVLFLNDPVRLTLRRRMSSDTLTSLGLWTWPEPVRPFMKGDRPSNVELMRLDPPRWFSGGGLFLTPEAGAPAEVAKRQHRAYIRPNPRRRIVMASGSRLDGRSAPLMLRIGEAAAPSHLLDDGQGFVLHAVIDPVVDRGYRQLSFESPGPALFTDLVVEQDDRPTILPTRGFYMPERDDKMRQFRWIAPRAEALVHTPPGNRVRLALQGQIPSRIYALPVTVVLEWDGAPLASVLVRTPEFHLEVPLPEPANAQRLGTLTLRSSHQFVPDEHLMNGDKRTLAIQVYELNVTAFRPAR